MSWLSSLWQDAQFEGALWQGLFQLVALTIAAAFGTFVFQRVRARQVARQVLIDEIDDFTTQLYKPRKLYQIFHENGDALLAEIDDPLQRRARRNAVLLQALEELIAVTGRFRSLQVKLVPLYGYNTELFAYYLA
ncbi:MAG TPA: hypothetical protein VF590_05460, partial [Isosphaeraceae bacterium]